MGTAKDWISVAIVAVGWGGLMLLRGTLRRRRSQLVPTISAVEAIGCALWGLGLGLILTFHLRAFRWPLILLVVAAFLGGAYFVDELKTQDVSSTN